MSTRGTYNGHDRCATCGKVRSDHGNPWASPEVRAATVGHLFAFDVEEVVSQYRELTTQLLRGGLLDREANSLHDRQAALERKLTAEGYTFKHLLTAPYLEVSL